MAPVDIVQLDLDKIPVHLLVHGQDLVEDLLRPVEREAQVADAARLTLLHQVVDHPVLDVAGTEGLDAPIADRVQQVIVEIIGLQVLEGVLIHRDGVLAGPVLEIGEFRGDEQFLARMPLQGDPGRLLRPALHINRRRIEIIDTMFNSVIHQTVDRILIDKVSTLLRCGKQRPTHTTISQQGDLVALRAGTISHFIGRYLTQRASCLAPCSLRRTAG